MDIKPTHSNVLLRRQVDKKKSPIILPEGKEDQSPFAEVLAVGPKVEQVKAGDVVLILNPFSAMEIPGSDKAFILNENLVSAVVSK